MRDAHVGKAEVGHNEGRTTGVFEQDWAVVMMQEAGLPSQWQVLHRNSRLLQINPWLMVQETKKILNQLK